MLAKYNSNKFNLLFLLSPLVFIISYLTISYYNRHTADDFYGIYEAQDKGWFKAAINLYFNWEGSYAQGLTLYPASLFFSDSSHLIYFNLINLIFIAGCLYYLTTTVFNKISLPSSPKEKLCLVLIFLSALFFSTVNIGENWFWLNGSVSYLTPIGFLALGLAFHFQKRYLIAFIFFFWFCGFRFSYNIILIMLMGFMSLYQVNSNKSLKPLYKHIPAWTGIILGTCIYIFAPGNSVRKAALHLPDPFSGGYLDFYNAWKTFFQSIFIRIPFFISLAIPIAIWFVRREIKIEIPHKLIRFTIGFLVSYIIIHFILMSYLYDDFTLGEHRTWFIYQLFLYGFLLTLIIKFYNNWIQKYQNQLITFSLFITLSLYMVKVLPALTNLNNYAAAYDARIKEFITLKSNYKSQSSDTLKFTPLPHPYPDFAENHLAGDSQCRKLKYVIHGKWAYFRSTDIAKRGTPGDWINTGIEKSFHLPFYIDLNTKENKQSIKD